MVRTKRQKIRRQIKNDDPELVRLTIKNHSFFENDWPDYFPPDNDWERLGKIIGRNTSLKELCLKIRDLEASKFGQFCGGLASNKSIRRLEVWDSGDWDGEMFKYLSTFMVQNRNLSCLVVDFGSTIIGHLSYGGIKSLTTALSKFNTLGKFECRITRGREHLVYDSDDQSDDNSFCNEANKIDDEAMGKLVKILANHPGLTDIRFAGVHLERRGIAALESLLGNPQQSVRKLRIDLPSLDDEEAKVFASAFSKNCSLRVLELDGTYSSTISAQGCRDIFAKIGQLASLESLNFQKDIICDDIATALANELSSGSKLKSFSITRNCCMREGWRDIFNALQSPLCLLQNLDIRYYSTLDDDLVAHLANSLVHNRALRRLVLQGSDEVSPSGWEPLSDVFRSNTALEKVDLSGNSFTNEVLVSFANSLAHNSKLKELSLGGAYGELEGVQQSTWDVFSRSLCNRSSVMDTYNSNHTLRRLFDPDQRVDSEALLPPHLASLLEINRDNSSAEAARRKILMVHFSGGDFRMQPFVDIKLKALPRAVAWMARDDLGHSLLYQYVQSSSVFIDIGGGSKKTQLTSKRQKCREVRN